MLALVGVLLGLYGRRYMIGMLSGFIKPFFPRQCSRPTPPLFPTFVRIPSEGKSHLKQGIPSGIFQSNPTPASTKSQIISILSPEIGSIYSTVISWSIYPIEIFIAY